MCKTCTVAQINNTNYNILNTQSLTMKIRLTEYIPGFLKTALAKK